MEHVTLAQEDVRFLGIMLPLLDEKTRRLFLGAFAERLGYGGASAVSEATGVSRLTISKGIKEIQVLPCDPRAKAIAGTKAVRSPGGGRKGIEEKFPDIRSALFSLVEEHTVGNPENPLCWTTKSLRRLAKELKTMGYTINYCSVGNLLVAMGYSLQQNRKYIESGNPGPDRDSQFHFINGKAKEFLSNHQPVISIDAKKKEKIGNYKNEGTEWRPINSPRKVKDHDFEKSKAIPYGIYDIGDNTGFVSVGVSADTAAFAVNSIRSWWDMVGKEKYPDAKKILITADGGGSNGSRCRLWKKCLADFSNETGLEVHVCHFPPGTSKWNKIEHRLFSYISKNWRGHPLVDLEVIINLISSTTTEKGLRVNSIKDLRTYEKGIKVPDEVLDRLDLCMENWHGDWNYFLKPHVELLESC